MILWLHNFGIHSRLYFLGAMTVFMSLVLGSVYLYGEYMNERAMDKEAVLVEAVGKLRGVTAAFEIMHHHERNYFKTPEPSRIHAFESSGEKLKHQIIELSKSALYEATKAQVHNLKMALTKYQDAFEASVRLKEKLGLNERSGKQGEFLGVAREIEGLLKAFYPAEMMVKFLMMRRNEKNYIISNKNKYLNNLSIISKEIQSLLETDITVGRRIVRRLAKYEKVFRQLTDAQKKLKTLIRKIGKQEELFISHLLEIKYISTNQLRQANEFQRQTREQSYTVILATIILTTIFLMFLSSAVATSLSRPLKYLSLVMKGLANGEVFHDVPYYSLDNELGEMARALNIFKTNIIARAKMELDLRQTAERYDLAIKGSNSGIWDWNVRERESHYSESFMEVLGYNGENHETSDKFLLNSIHPDHRDIYLAAIKNNLLNGDHRIDIEIRVRHKNGSYIWLQTIGWAVEKENGKVIRAVGKIIDVSRLKETELELRKHQTNLEIKVAERTKELQASQSTLTEAINAIPEGFILSDTEDTVIMVNDLMKEYYPSAASVMQTGTHLQEMIRASFPDETDEKIERRMCDYSNARSGEIRRLENGTWLHVIRKKIPGLGIIALYNDVTAFRQQEDELTEQAAKLELALSSERELGELQRSFVSMASHEFRTPLAIIDGVAHRLSRKAGRGRLEPDDVLLRVEQIRSSVKRMVNLMESTLSAARMDAGKVTIKPRDCNLRAVIEEVCERQRGISPSHNITTDLEDIPAIIRGDEPALEQVFTNLLSNAVKYAPDAPDIEIKAWWRKEDYVMISIRDYGLGIDDDDLPNMFGRFFRAKSSTGIAGTGIGLNLVKMFVEEHGGRVMVTSEIGVGSTFSVCLPIAGPAVVNEDVSIAKADEKAA